MFFHQPRLTWILHFGVFSAADAVEAQNRSSIAYLKKMNKKRGPSVNHFPLIIARRRVDVIFICSVVPSGTVDGKTSQQCCSERGTAFSRFSAAEVFRSLAAARRKCAISGHVLRIYHLSRLDLGPGRGPGGASTPGRLRRASIFVLSQRAQQSACASISSRRSLRTLPPPFARPRLRRPDAARPRPRPASRRAEPEARPASRLFLRRLLRELLRELHRPSAIMAAMAPPSSLVLCLAAVALALPALALPRLPANPTISHNDGRGTIVGARLRSAGLAPAISRDYAAFWGVPYAEPPVGKLRFKVSRPGPGAASVAEAFSFRLP